MSDSREHDIVLFGATGFTGRLTAAHLVTTHLASGLRLALAGRDRKKLEGVRDELAASVPAARELPILVADAHDAAALGELAKKTVVLTTVGPYAKYGDARRRVRQHGTHYADLWARSPSCGDHRHHGPR
jgi:short subunit dehydrogenase-like uncharacterized protein